MTDIIPQTKRIDFKSMKECNKGKRMSRRTFLNLLFGVPVVTVMGGCTETENSDHHKGAVMRDEIIVYVKSIDIDSGGKSPVEQIDVTHLIERYIKVGDSLEAAKDILMKNGFSVAEVEDRRFRIQATYKIEGSWWYRRDIVIFLGSGSQSGRVGSVLAKVNLKTI